MTFKRFLRDTSGAIAVWGALAMPVVVGSAAFSVDASRLYNMDHDLQSGADALARTAASELDFRADAIARANLAIASTVSNTQKFGTSTDGKGRQAVRVKSTRYLRELPSLSSTVAPASMETTDPRKAKFVEVVLEPENIDTIFPASFVSSTMRLKMDARATAGADKRICGVAPIFVCNPVEGTGQNFLDVLEDPAFQRRQVQFKRPTGQMKGKGKGKGGGNSSSGGWGPGSFGYLEIPGHKGASAMREAVGIDVPDICMSAGDTVQLRTGNINSMHFGFNTRFDMYDGPMKKKRTDVRFAPAANVVRGHAGKTCSTSPSSAALGLPRDDCQMSGTCTMGNGQFGDGNWDFVSYMAKNHNFMRNITIDGTRYTVDYNSWTASPATPPSRYGMYRWEIDNDCIPGKKTYGNSSQTAEEGIPQCHADGASTADVDRRVIYAAVLNCQDIADTTGMRSNVDLPVETFVKVFLTEPVGSGSTPTIYGELIGAVEGGVDGGAETVAELTR